MFMSISLENPPSLMINKEQTFVSEFQRNAFCDRYRKRQDALRRLHGMSRCKHIKLLMCSDNHGLLALTKQT